MVHVDKLSDKEMTELYGIVSELNDSHKELNATKLIKEKNPSRTIAERELTMQERYYKALTDFNYFLNNCIVIKEKEEN